MKKKLRIAMAISLVLSILIGSVNAFASEAGSEITMGTLEDEMIAYVNEHYPEIKYGTKEYLYFLKNQLTDEPDKLLCDKNNFYDLMLYANQYIYEFDKAQASIEEDEIFSYPASERELTPNEIRVRADLRESKDISRQAANSNTHIGRSVNYTYDPDAAVDYALEWALDRNPDYNDHSNDCTNFVSQCLVAGGINMKYPRPIPNGVNDTTSYWYSTWYYEGSVKMYNESTSFIRVVDLWDYIYDHDIYSDIMYSSAAGLDDVQDEANIGDIIMLRYYGGDYSHWIIITGGRRGNLKYSGHTNDKKNNSLSALEDTGITQYRTVFL